MNLELSIRVIRKVAAIVAIETVVRSLFLAATTIPKPLATRGGRFVEFDLQEVAK
jgi:hypothetical protein